MVEVPGDHVVDSLVAGAPHEVEGGALQAEAPRAADAVEVRLERRVPVPRHRHVVVHHQRHRRLIEPAREHVRGDEDLRQALAELVDHAVALLKLHVAGDGGALPAGLVERHVEALGGLALLDEHDGLAELVAGREDAVLQHLLLVRLPRALHEVLLDHVQRQVLLPHKHLVGAAHKLDGKVADPVAEGGREQQDLALFGAVGNICDDALRVEEEALRVEHVVRLVEHHHPHVLRVQHQRLAAHPVLQLPRRSDHHLVDDTLAAGLLVVLGGRGGARDGGVLAHALQHGHVLHHQLARRADAHGLGRLQARVHAREHAEHEACGFAAAVVRLGN
mmetsp:Transcript_23146/g.50731  ORF Transcript_23146/g.50731 Transcript_23146/m.50731 type:complete len:334 (-) Transcript_23146:571-1572(-)